MVLSSCASCSVICVCGDECWRVGTTGESWHVGINQLCLLLSSSSDQYTCMDTASFVVVIFLFFFSFLFSF